MKISGNDITSGLVAPQYLGKGTPSSLLFLNGLGQWAAPPGGSLVDGDYGDITVSGSGTVWTIDNGVVSLAKMANMATASLIYRKTAGSGAPEVNTLATLKTDLGLTGTNSGDQTITLTGDVTGSGTGSFAATLATAQPAVHTWALAQTFTVAPVFTDQVGTRTALGLGTLATQSGTFSGTSSGTNTGDQTSIVGITGTKAQFNTAVSDGDIVYLDSADTITGVKTFATSTIKQNNPAGTFAYTIVPSAIAAARNLTLPLLTADDTLAVLGLAQTFTGAITTSSGTIINSGSSTATTKGMLTANTASAVPNILITGYSLDTSSDTIGGGVIYMTHNGTGNRQICFGASENFNSSSAAVFRFMCGAGIANIDGTTGDGVWRLPINLGTDTSSVAVGNLSLAYNATLPGKLSVYPEANGVGVNINLAASGTGDLQRWSNNSGTAQSVVTSTGNFGVRRTTATAYLHLGAGTASASTAPLKLTSGTVNGTPEDGAIEFDGTHFYGSIGSTRYQLDQQAGGSGLTHPQVMARGVFGGPF